jgi:hypothetical protein
MDIETASERLELQKIFEQNGIKDHRISCAAAFIMDNIAKGYPTSDLIKTWPFDSAYAYLISAGLVAGQNSLCTTPKGREIYESKAGKVYFVQ